MRMQTFLIKVYIRREIMNKKRAAGLVAALLVVSGTSGGVLAAGAQLDEVIVTADRYEADTAQLVPVASGMVGTKQNVGTLGSQDVLDTPFEQMTFTKEGDGNLFPAAEKRDGCAVFVSICPCYTRVYGYESVYPRFLGRQRQLEYEWHPQHESSDDHADQLYGSRRSTGRAKHWCQWDWHFHGRLCRRDGRRHNEKSTGKANAECGSFLV